MPAGRPTDTRSRGGIALPPALEADGRYRLRDPVHLRVFQNLGLIGPGAQAFFFDTCRVLDASPPFNAATHTVWHLYREVESSVRAVLRRALGLDRPMQGDGGHNHRTDILGIMSALGVPENDPLTQAWLRLVGKENADGLARRAHREALDHPRPVDQEFRAAWAEAVDFLDFVLRQLESRFYSALKPLEEMAKKQEPTPADVNVLRQEIPNNPVARHHFFGLLSGPGWLEPLERAAFFMRPPDPIEDQETGVIRHPPWPPLRFAARMTPLAPDTVARIVEGIADTDNVAVLEDIADVAIRLPPQAGARLVPRFIAFLARWPGPRAHETNLGMRLATLADGLVRNGERDAGLKLIEALFDGSAGSQEGDGRIAMPSNGDPERQQP